LRFLGGVGDVDRRCDGSLLAQPGRATEASSSFAIQTGGLQSVDAA
jgi:hypothetical protein